MFFLGRYAVGADLLEFYQKIGVALGFYFDLCMQREVDESVNFFLPHFGTPRSTALYYDNQTLGEEKKNRVSGSQGLGMCFIEFTRVYIVAMYSPMLNLFTGFIFYLTMNHDSPRQQRHQFHLLLYKI